MKRLKKPEDPLKADPEVQRLAPQVGQLLKAVAETTARRTGVQVREVWPGFADAMEEPDRREKLIGLDAMFREIIVDAYQRAGASEATLGLLRRELAVR